MMSIAGYEWKDGARFQSGALDDAKQVGDHLELLRKECKGELTPRDVVNDARNPNSPLHSHFEWDDSEAAEAYRLQQARNLIRSVVAIYVDDERPAQRVQAFVHVPEPGAPHYRDTAHALSQTKTRAMVLKRAWNELQAWRKRYAELSEFAEIVKVIDAIEPPKAARK